MKRMLIAAGFCGMMIPASGFAQNQGYEGLIAGGKPAPAGQGQAAQPAPPPQEFYQFVATGSQNNPQAQAAQRAEALRAQQELERQKVLQANEEQMKKAMEEAKAKQEALSGHAARLERESDAGHASGEDWNQQQHEAYNKSLQDLTRRQEDLEALAKEEMEKAMEATR